MRPPRPQRGIALIVVLWILVLLTIVVGTYAVLARTESLQSRFLLDTTRARFAAEAGVHRAAYEMRNPDDQTRWVPDGRPYLVEFGGLDVEIRVRDESGKINVNNASADELSNLLISLGLEEGEAWALADAIEDWRDEDDLPRLYGAEGPEYEAAGYPYGPANEPFASIDELQQVIGVSWELFKQLEPILTVHSRGRLNPAFASARVLAANPNITPEDAEAFVQEREQLHPRDQQALLLPDGTAVGLQGRGRTFSIRSRAALDTGIWSEIRATIELGGNRRGQPFRVLRWRDNVEDP